MSQPTTLRSRATVADRTAAFHFTRPDGFEFVAGQAVELLLDGPHGDAQGHAFSIVSAPHERELVVATRLRDSAFKRALNALQPGASARLDGPFGELTLADDARPVVLVAGGIGITPFVSMLRDARQHASSRAMALVYSNRQPRDAAFLAELQAMEAAHAPFRLHATMTALQRDGDAWRGHARRIDAEMLEEAARGMTAPRWYVAGPPGLVAAAAMALDDLGVPAGHVRTETFEGYA